MILYFIIKIILLPFESQHLNQNFFTDEATDSSLPLSDLPFKVENKKNLVLQQNVKQPLG